MTKRDLIGFAAAVCVALSLASAAPAATLLEFDFRTAASGTDVAASASVASAVGQLTDTNGDGSGTYPTVNTGPAVPAGTLPYSAKITSGSLDMTGNFVTKQGMLTKDTDPTAATNNDWIDYYGAGVGYGTGSAIVVFKPNLTTHGRSAFFSKDANGVGGVWLFDSDDTLGPRLIMQGVDINVGNIGAWNTSTWYLLAATWQTGSQAKLFFQPISPVGATILTAAGGTVSTVADAAMNSPIAFGQRYPATFGENFNGRFAMFRFTDQYMDAAAFQVLYAELVPEPGMMSLLGGLAGIALIRGRNRRNRSTQTSHHFTSEARP